MKKIILSYIFLWLLAGSYIFAQNTNAQKLNYAKSFEQSGDMETAGRIYKELYESDPKNEEYFNSISRILKSQTKFSELLPIVEKFSQIKKSVEVYSLYAETLWRTGNSDLANEYWSKAITLNPDNTNTYKIISQAQIDVGQYPKAIITLEQGRKTIGKSILFSDELSRLYIASGDYKKGTEETLNLLAETKNIAMAQGRISALMNTPESKKYILSALEEASSDNDINYLNLKIYAWYLRAIGEYEKAFETFKKMDKVLNAQGREVMNFANDSRMDGQYDMALKGYEYIIAMGKESRFLSAALYGYPRTLEQKLLSDSSLSRESALRIIDYYRDIIKQFPDMNTSADARYRIAVIAAEHIYDYDMAIKEIEILANQKMRMPVTASALNILGDIYLVRGELEKAKDAYNSIIANYQKMAPEDALKAKFNLAEIEFYSGNIDTSQKMFKELTIVSNTDLANDAIERNILIEQNKTLIKGMSLFAQSQLKLKQKKYNESIELLQQTISASEGADLAERSMLSVAEIYFSLSKYDSSLISAKNITENYSKSIYRDQALFISGNCYIKLNQKEQAISSFKELISDYPRSIYLQESRDKIRLLRGDKNL